MTQSQINRLADLIAKGAVYNAVQYVRRPPLHETHDRLVVRLNRTWRPTARIEEVI
jgi:hypothetical protein